MNGIGESVMCFATRSKNYSNFTVHSDTAISRILPYYTVDLGLIKRNLTVPGTENSISANAAWKRFELMELSGSVFSRWREGVPASKELRPAVATYMDQHWR